MAKRFTDTAKWKKEFIKGLSAKHKLLWFYILDDCDHAGIWEVDFEVASIRIGEPLSYNEAFIALGCQIVPIGKTRWWIKDFISFQYGNLTPKNKMYEPVMSLLKKYNIDPNIPHDMEHLSPIDGVKDIDIVKDKDKVKDKEEDFVYNFVKTEKSEPLIVPRGTKEEIFEQIFSDEIFIDSLALTHRGKDINRAWEECYLHHSNGKSPPADVGEWKQKLNTWLINTKNGTGKKGREDTVNSRREAFARRHGAGTGS